MPAWGEELAQELFILLALAAQLPAQGASPGGQLSQSSATPAQYKVTETSTESLVRESSKWKTADEKKKKTYQGKGN